jgi:hypothetical protein
MSGITFKSFLECVDHVTAVGKPVLLRSRHGVGKSSVVYQYAINKGLPVVERRASQMTEGDLLGLPVIDEVNNTTTWNVPDWYKQCCDDACLLFIDEIDRATMEVRQGFFELTDSRKLAGHVLHPNTLIFAAVNGGEDASQYQVGEMDPAELDRWTVFDLEPSVKDWVSWGKKSEEIPSVVLEFVSGAPQHLEHKDDFEPNKVYPSRRSWHRLAQCLVKGDLMQLGQTQSPAVVNLVKAFVGLEASIGFTEFLKNYAREVSPEDILKKGKLDLVKDFSLTDHVALIDKMVAKKCFDDVSKVNKKFFVNLGNYFMVCPSEAAAKLQESLGESGGVDGFIVRMCKAVPDVKMKLVSLFSDQSESDKEE